MIKKKPDGKELKRRNKRLEKKQTIRRAYETPAILIESNLASPSFASAVSAIVDKIDLFDEKLFSPLVRQHFRNLKLHDNQYAMKHSILSSGQRVTDQVGLGIFSNRITSELGELIVNEVDEDLFPMNDVEVLFIGNEIVLSLSSMLQRNVRGREVFHSRNRLQVKVESKEYLLAFSKHTIEKICRRFRPDFLSYIGLGEAHAIFSYLNYAEVVRLPKGNWAVSIFDFCSGPGMWQYDNYIGRCLPGVASRGPEIWRETKSPYGYRIGYCPIDLVDGYAITRTFLPPGFAKTPERHLLKSKCSDAEKRYRLTRIAQNMAYDSLRLGKGFDAIEWFHKNGVPQVIDPPVPLFDEEYFNRKIGQA